MANELQVGTKRCMAIMYPASRGYPYGPVFEHAPTFHTRFSMSIIRNMKSTLKKNARNAQQVALIASISSLRCVRQTSPNINWYILRKNFAGYTSILKVSADNH